MTNVPPTPRLSTADLQKLAALIDDKYAPTEVVLRAQLTLLKDNYTGLLGEFQVMFKENVGLRKVRNDLTVQLACTQEQILINTGYRVCCDQMFECPHTTRPVCCGNTSFANPEWANTVTAAIRAAMVKAEQQS